MSSKAQSWIPSKLTFATVTASLTCNFIRNFPIFPGAHAPENLRSALEESIKALGPHKIRIFYLHGPDRSVPYEDTLREVNELYKKGYLYASDKFLDGR